MIRCADDWMMMIGELDHLDDFYHYDHDDDDDDDYSSDCDW